MSPLRGLLVTLTFALSLAQQPAQAAWGDWLPFATKSTTRQPMLDGKPLNPTYTSNNNTPSVWTRMSNGTQRFFSGTRKLFTGGRTETTAMDHRPNWSNSNSSIQTQKSGGWFGGLFTSPPHDEEPAKPHDWISQDRPSMF